MSYKINDIDINTPYTERTNTIKSYKINDTDYLKLSTKADEWNETIDLPEYKINDEPIGVSLKPGTVPSFKKTLAKIVTSGSGEIIRDNDYLTIKHNGAAVAKISAGEFRDGVVPTRLIAFAVGAGGGGGSGNWNTASGGGGAGAFWFGIINLNAGTVSFSIGAGGQGGTGENNGKNGGSTTITVGNAKITCGGGNCGKYGGSGGSGGSVSYSGANNNAYWTRKTYSGSSGSTHEKDGETMYVYHYREHGNSYYTPEVLDASAVSASSIYNYKLGKGTPKRNTIGGKGQPNNGGGGGGASLLGNGGNGGNGRLGGNNRWGKAGSTPGGGGGGAGQGSGANPTGGDGANGAVYFYY